MNILTEYYECFVLQIQPEPIIHKDGEERRKSTSTLSNFMYQFRYKRNGFAKYTKIDSGTPEIRGTHFEQHCYTTKLLPWTLNFSYDTTPVRRITMPTKFVFEDLPSRWR